MNIITEDISPRNYSSVCICICGQVADLQIDDYVTEPMVWCDLCGGRLIICKNCVPEKIDITDHVKYLEKYYEEIDCESIRKQAQNYSDYTLWNLMCKKKNKGLASNLRQLKSWNSTANKFNIMSIDQICTQQIYQDRWIDGITENQIKGVISGKFDREMFIIEEDAFVDGEYEDTPPPDNMFITLPHKTYDVEKNDIENVDTSHDGCVIWIKCSCDYCDTRITMNYSGD
jgi:hypothetical protein